MSIKTPKFVIASVGAFLALAAPCMIEAATVVVPYSNTFTSAGSNGDFVANGGTWSVDSGTYRNAMTGTSVPTSATVSANLTGGFVMSTTFVMNSVSGGTPTATIGFGALGASSSMTTSSGFLLADVNVSGGGMRFVTVGTSSNTNHASGTWAGGSLVAGTTYTMTLSGTYQPNGSLSLSLVLTDGTTRTEITDNIVTSLNGTNFGYRNRTNAATGLDVSFDNFNLTQVPEPSKALLAAAGLFSLALRRRR